jgi:hypothetical protein
MGELLFGRGWYSASSGWENALTLLDTQLEKYEQSLNEDLNRIVWQVPLESVPLRKADIDPYVLASSVRVASPRTPFARCLPPGNED